MLTPSSISCATSFSCPTITRRSSSCYRQRLSPKARGATLWHRLWRSVLDVQRLRPVRRSKACVRRPGGRRGRAQHRPCRLNSCAKHDLSMRAHVSKLSRVRLQCFHWLRFARCYQRIPSSMWMQAAGPLEVCDELTIGCGICGSLGFFLPTQQWRPATGSPSQLKSGSL
jgi:hypothetical protein